MKKTAIAIATSLTFFTGSLAAATANEGAAADVDDSPAVTVGQPNSEAEQLDQGQGMAAGEDQQGNKEQQVETVRAEDVKVIAEDIVVRHDKDGDGVLDEEELSAFGATAAGGDQDSEQLMQKLDKDKSGTVDQQEIRESGMAEQDYLEGSPEETGTIDEPQLD